MSWQGTIRLLLVILLLVAGESAARQPRPRGRYVSVGFLRVVEPRPTAQGTPEGKTTGGSFV